MAHIAKYQSGAIGHMCALYENEAMQANGYNLGPKRLISQVQFISERISALALKRHMRKDAVSLCDCIVTLPRSFDDNREREFFKTAYTFLSQRYGVDNVVSAYIHRKERLMSHSDLWASRRAYTSPSQTPCTPRSRS